MGENQMESMAWGSLGNLAQDMKEWDEAERYYKEAFALHEKLGDFLYAAATSNNLGNVANNAGRPQEAERWYLRAIELKEKHSTPSNLAISLSNLASLYLSQNRLDKAETYARRALAIKETLDLSSEPWKTYSLLAQIAEKRGRMDEVRAWRRKEQESFAAFAGADVTAQTKAFESLIQGIVAATNGNEDAKQEVEAVFDQLIAGNWQIVDAIKAIWAGERDTTKLTEGIDRNSSLIVRRILQVLNGDTKSPAANSQATLPQPSPARGEGEEQGVTLPQLLELVERAAGGDQQLGGQLFNVFQQMARSGDAFQSALGNVLLRVLIGDKNPNLDGLPDEVASTVRGMLGRVKNKGSS
jgi:hypothetical protein